MIARLRQSVRIWIRQEPHLVLLGVICTAFCALSAWAVALILLGTLADMLDILGRAIW